VLDASQAVVATYSYNGFGRLMNKSATLDQPFRFSTKRYDEGTGLSYYGYRFYAPVIERWLNRDPLGEAGGVNLYGFVLNDPVNAVDPWGLYAGDEFDNNGLENCPCGTSRRIDWDCVNAIWAQLNGGNSGITVEAVVGVGGGVWGASGAAGATAAGAFSGVVGTWAGSTWLGAIMACSKCLPD